MENKFWLITSVVVIGVSLYYISKLNYFWINIILIAASIYFGVCYEKNRERQGEEVSQEPPPSSKIPEEFKMENKQFPVR